MAWRWYKRLRIFGGLSTNLSNNGIGWSWGIGLIRIGRSPNGRRWVSVGVPGTGFRYVKYLKNDQPHQGYIEEEITVAESPEHPPKTIRKWRNIK